MTQTVSIKSCGSRAEAELLKSLLESNGIHALVLDEDCAGLPLYVSGGVKLQVLQEDVERALLVIETSEETES